MTLSRLQTTQERRAKTGSVSFMVPNTYNALVRKLGWLLCFASVAALLFSTLSPTIGAFIFLAAAALLALAAPNRGLRALFSDWLPWMYVIFVFFSVLWSPVADLSAKYAVEVALTAAAALVLARGLEPRSFLSALMCAYFAVTIGSVFLGRYAMNAGALAMIGVFGSKNAFSVVQAVFFLASGWVLLSADQSIFMRSLALLGVCISPVLLVAGRSADAVAPVVLATGITLLVFSTSWLPLLARTVAFCAGAFLIVCIFGFAFIFKDTLFGQLLIITGKDVTLSGRTYMWERATELMRESPLLGTGYGGFWFQGNPYAEDLWAHFGVLIRGGFNFHNLWYEMGVELGYLGISIAFLTMLIVSIRVFRWVARAPTAESHFFLAFIMIVDMRSFLEVDMFAQFAVMWVIFIVAGYYARNAERIASMSSGDSPRLFNAADTVGG